MFSQSGQQGAYLIHIRRDYVLGHERRDLRTGRGEQSLIGSKWKSYRGAYHNRPAGESGSSHGYMLGMIGSGKRVLEFGCASGYMSELLARADCRVTGIEIDPKAAAEARNFCDEVIVADLDARPLVDLLPATPFDVAVFGDVLEHLRDPWKMLDDTRAFLAPDGFAVLSVPNIAHGSVRLSLLRGNFDYTSEGLLDDTHLRFFTLKSLRELCLRAGYRIEAIERTKVPIFEAGHSHPNLDPADFDPAIVAAIAEDPDHDTLQFIIKAVPFDDRGKFDNAVDQYIEAQALAETLQSKLDRALRPETNGVVQLQTELTEAQAELASEIEQRKQIELDGKRLRTMIDQLERERALLESSLEERDRVAAALRTELDARKNKVRELERGVADLKERLEAEGSTRIELENSRRAIAEAFAAYLRDEIERVRASTAELDGEIRSIQQSRWWKIKTLLRLIRKPPRGVRS
jgi:2-polyprenyl-3-methyl-5-hydroxy-6-metoxy-1,4-benzoquinol methylase